MYNSEQKTEFLDTILNDNSYKSFSRVFRTIEPMEDSFGKDICEMSVEEILVVLDLKTGTRLTGTENTMSLLRSYIDWCIQNGKTSSENNLDKIDATEIDKSRLFRSKYIKSPEELEEMIAIVFNRNFDYNSDVEEPKELCVRLCYEGFADEEIVLLKKTDVDYENGIIRSPIYDDIIYKVSNRIIELCKKCSEQESVSYLAKSGMRLERLCNNEYIIRQRIGSLRGNPEDKPLNKTMVIRRIKEFSDKYVGETDIYKSLTAGKMRESSLYYQIHNAADKNRFIEESVKCDILTKNPELSTRQVSEKIRQIKKSFEIWEEVFY